MKKYILIIAALLGVMAAYTQDTIGRYFSFYAESQNVFKRDWLVPAVKAESIFTRGALGVSAFALVQPKWAQCLVGVAVLPKLKRVDACTITAKFGIEQAKTPVRCQVSAYLQKEFYAQLVVYEHGGSGYFYLFTGMFKVHPSTQIGLYLERFVGIGPRLEFSQSPLTLFVCGAWDFEDTIPSFANNKGQPKVNFGINLFLAKQWMR